MREIHPVAADVLETRTVTMPDGSVRPATSHVFRESCELFYELVERSGATRAIEVGMAFGVSTVCIADALRRNSPDAKLLSLDPTQTMSSSWNSAGLSQLSRAGLSDVVELYEETSQAALPRFVRDGIRCQFAFIDGWHTFDHTLVDFFYIDQLLDAGGHVMFDDVGSPAIRAVVRFVIANRDYELVETLHYPEEASATLKLKRAAKRIFRRLGRNDSDPSSLNAGIFEERLTTAHTAAFRKRGDDRRSFNHFEPF